LSYGDGISPTYFRYEATDYKILEPTEITYPPQPSQVQVLAFKKHDLPIFLEGNKMTPYYGVLSSIL
jgi:hypothetical protein